MWMQSDCRDCNIECLRCEKQSGVVCDQNMRTCLVDAPLCYWMWSTQCMYWKTVYWKMIEKNNGVHIMFD